MGRYIVTAKIAVEIIADDVAGATSYFDEVIAFAKEESNGIAELTVLKADTKRVPYMAPKGAGRWAKAAEEIAFDHHFAGEPRKMVCRHDGSWWWTDGHAALRLHGEAAPEGYRRIEDQKWAAGIGDERRPTTWGLLQASPQGARHHCADADHQIGIQWRLLKVVADSVPGVEWRVKGQRDAILAYDGPALVAVVMPVLTHAARAARPNGMPLQ